MSASQYLQKVVQYVSAVCVMVATALCWWNEFYFLILLIIAGWLLLPMVVVVIVSWCINLKTRKTLFVLDSVALLFLIAYLTIGNAQQRCDADIMERHLAKKQAAMQDVIDYTREALYDGCDVTIEFSHGKVDMFNGYHRRVSAYLDEDMEGEMKKVGLTEEELSQMRRLLRRAGCIGISIVNEGYVSLWFRRVGFGMYEYYFYDQPIPADEWEEMMEDCSLIPYNDTVVFKYSSGALGGDCFPGRRIAGDD